MARTQLSWIASKQFNLIQTATWLAVLLLFTLNGSRTLSAVTTSLPVSSAVSIPADLQVVKGGPAPEINGVQRYINPTFLETHSTQPFDSRGGDLLVMYASSHGGVKFAPSDNFGNTWISISGPTSTTAEFDLRSQIWYAVRPKVGPNHTVTMRLSARQSLVMSIFVVKGVNLYSPIDSVSLINSDNRTESMQVFSPRVTTSNANDLLLAWCKVADIGRFASGPGFSQQPGASSSYLGAESGTATQPGSYKAAFLLNKPQAWQSAVVAIDGSPERATLRWNSGTQVQPPGLQYVVERCRGTKCNQFTQIGVTRQLTYTDSGLSASAIYRYRVRARSADGRLSAYSRVVSLASPSIAPSVPGNLAADVIGFTKIRLSWTPASDDGDIEQYLVERCTGTRCNNFARLAAVSDTSYQDTGRMPWLVYKYRIRAVDDSGNVGPAVSVALRTVAIPHRRDLAMMFAMVLALLCGGLLLKAQLSKNEQFGSPHPVRVAASENEQIGS